MSALNFLLVVLCAALCGAIAQSLVGSPRGGYCNLLAIGIIGALFGCWLYTRAEMLETIVTDGGALLPFAWSMCGASGFMALTRWFEKRPRKVRTAPRYW